MKFTATASDLQRGLKNVKGPIEKRSTIPVLSNVLVSVADDGQVALQATDLDMQVALKVAATTVERSGAITVDADMFAAFVSKLPKSAEVKIEVDQSGAHPMVIRSGRARCTLNTLPAADFPDIPLGELDHRFEMSGADLIKLFGRTSFAISTEETRYYLNGVYFHQNTDRSTPPSIRGVATDGHRLAMIEAPVPAGSDQMPGVIVPRKTVTELLKLVDKDATVKIALSERKIMFDIGGTVLISKLIDGTFPDYIRVIPTGNDKIALFQRVDAAGAIGRVTTVAAERGRGVKLAFEKGLVTLSITNADTGSAQEEAEIEYSAEPLAIGFNSMYLNDLFSQITGATVRVALDTPGGPALVTDPDDPGATFVLMPLRI